MVIVTFKAGRLGNRLFHFSSFIVNSLEHKYKLIYPFFDEYSEYFSYLDGKKINEQKIFLSFTKTKPLDKLFKLLVKGFFHYKFFIGRLNINFHFIKLISLYKEDNSKTEYDLGNPRVINNWGKIFFLNGWLFRNKTDLSQHYNRLREIFKPKEEYLSKINDLIIACHQKGDIIIGVHIRRGDYRTYNGGKYFLDDATYLNRMKAVANNFSVSGKKCVFLICSNEKLDLANFSDIKFVLGDGHLITDLYSLSQVDYLIGPPSTFTAWSSFYGKVPLLAINNQKSKISLTDFKIVDDL